MPAAVLAFKKRLPTPQELGFPAKFQAWRPQQEEMIEFLLASQKRVKAVCAPTGSGKTPAIIGYALISKQPTCIVTESRGLQDQCLETHPSVVDLRGRRNYDCPMKPDYTCEEGYATRCPYKGTVSCPASQAEMRAATSWLVVTNYDKWTASKKFGNGMSHFTQVIFDEGDETPAKLASAMQVTLQHREIEERLGLDFLSGTAAEEFVNWKVWAQRARAEAQLQLDGAKSRLVGDPKPAWVRDYLHLRHLTKRLATLSTASPDNWVVDEARDAKGRHAGYQFDPIRPGRYAEAALLLRLPSIVVISATLRPKTLHMIGIGKDHYDFKEFDSDFDPARCPIFYIPRMRVDNRAESLAMLWVLLDQLAAQRTDRKGLVQTVSFARRDDLLSTSRFAASMLINTRGEPTLEILDQYRRSGPGTILVSPSFGRGYDFPGKDCEWQFVCKIPFPDGRNKIIRARSEDDKEYAPFLAMTKLVQFFGRHMRYQQDQGESFIGDMHLDWFMPRFGHLAPRAFHRRYRKVSVVPQPLPRL